MREHQVLTLQKGCRFGSKSMINLITNQIQIKMQSMSDLMHRVIENRETMQQSQSPTCKTSAQTQNNNIEFADDALILEGIKRLQVAFPNNDRAFYLLLAERVKKRRMTCRAYVNAVNTCIDSYPYARLTIQAVLGTRF